MKNYFFINPVAGQGKGIKKLAEEIKTAAAELSMDVEIYMTRSVGDGERKAREIAENLNGEEARFFACGGDGTNNEVINGVIGFENISVGCVPIGTGNDMVRNFTEAGDFLNIKGQLLGTTKKIDLMKYTGVLNGAFQQRYCVNMFNIGFDCNVVELAGRLKQKPMIAGSAAYLLAVLGMFIKKKGIRLTLQENDETLVDGEVLLCAIANGSYCGGGIYTAPQASMYDGYFDLNIVKNVSRGTFLKLFPKYKNGEHLNLANIEEVLTLKQCQSLHLIPQEKHFFLCADGEISLAETIDFEIAPHALSFVIPARSFA
ncbi:MAG: diacylglycerol/lipid kinase family protein [Emergencia sp.]|nr:YegS/Rv2252/BmrU family lipid kinase [Emergencia sp.]